MEALAASPHLSCRADLSDIRRLCESLLASLYLLLFSQLIRWVACCLAWLTCEAQNCQHHNESFEGAHFARIWWKETLARPAGNKTAAWAR